MFSTAVFGISLLGLIVLFTCKALELSRNIKTPLHSIRQKADPILTKGWKRFSFVCGMAAGHALRVFVAWINTGIRKTAFIFDTTVHIVAAKLNRYLRTRRLHIRHGDEVSAHLKTVLQKNGQNTKRPDSK